MVGIIILINSQLTFKELNSSYLVHYYKLHKAIQKIIVKNKPLNIVQGDYI